MSSIPLLCTLTLMCVFPLFVNSRWCTRIVSQPYVKVHLEHAKCNNSYQGYCGWLTSDMCTYYEIVDCVKERNVTGLVYKIIESCCPGYYLDPINNVTCIKSDDTGKENVTYDTTLVSGTDKSPLGVNAKKKTSTVRPDSSLADGVQKVWVTPGTPKMPVTNAPVLDSTGGMTTNLTSNSSGTDLGSGWQNSQDYSDDSLFLGMSHGALAGIICCLLFVLCVTILIALHVHKKKRYARMKKNSSARDMEFSQKMIQDPAA